VKGIAVSGLLLFAVAGESQTAHPAAPWIVDTLLLIFFGFVVRGVIRLWRRRTKRNPDLAGHQHKGGGERWTR